MDKGTCGVGTCDKPVRTAGYCHGHYARLNRYGDVQADVPLGYRTPRGNIPICVAPECGGWAKARQMCTLHYQRWQAHGSFDLPRRPLARETGAFRHASPQGYNFHKCRCDECVAWHREYLATNKERFAANVRRCQLAAYGITPQEYDALGEAQGWVCAVCQHPMSDGRRRRLCVDHDHETGHVRGLLCGLCNTAAGQLMDDPAIVDELARYLRRTRGVAALHALTGEPA